MRPRPDAAQPRGAVAQRTADPGLHADDESIEALTDGRDPDTDDIVAALAELGEPEGDNTRTGQVREERSPALAAGDVDAAVTETGSGEEAAGGSTPTPDQDNVDEIGAALGVEYQPDEPLRPTEKIARRDLDRWELNPASSEDFAERQNLRQPAVSTRRRRGR